MINYKMKGSINSVETFGLLDGPGIRYVLFFNGCLLRCKFCHNPEMFTIKEKNVTVKECVDKILRFKPYFNNSGGVTLSGGEPLLQVDFLIELCKALKNENIHITLDTAGVGIGKYEEVLSLVDLVILDIKHLTREGYQDITGHSIDEFNKFVMALTKSNKDVWIRQVVVPLVHDNQEYMLMLQKYLGTLKNIKKVEFLPYHKIGDSKYDDLGIINPYKDKEAMDAKRCEELYNKYIKDNLTF